MGKTSVEDVVKELRRMSKRMKRVSTMLGDLSEKDDRFGTKAEEMEISSNIVAEWSDSIYDEFLKEDEMKKRYADAKKIHREE